ncbi:hypothetical protein AMTRI_Chr02g219870 [Amborella trichopoda]|uniref:IBH1-like N-terminal domain-containing protein n=1 Tax=Amborella trichopoda TaxID=13333 RepID=W1P6T8_AMBTC|nr:transcription factor bHLH149 [Amborella trichopoda]ERN03301.1 hypothetical protein AMTR_s00003p00228070 [Amborella trichopoda]|eukprot:XP_006841626.1 transcription factor bHLH149 [Amborella trichopoda]
MAVEPKKKINQSQLQWKTYASKLVEALRHVRKRNGNSSKISPSRQIRETADRTLAIAAKGRTRWSRAILASRRSTTLKKVKRAGLYRLRKPAHTKLVRATKRSSENKTPAIERRVLALGRLIPGGRKMGLPVLLEEAGDYISALEIQVKAMRAIAELIGSAQPSDRQEMQ